MYKYPWMSAFIFTMIVCGVVTLIYFVWKIFSFVMTSYDWMLFSLMILVLVGARFYLFERHPGS
jgi:hypothetical protein